MNKQNSNENVVDESILPDLVLEAFDGYPKQAQAILLSLRELIFVVGKSDGEIGELREDLRWGELSFLTEKPNTGSMIRLALTKSGEPAMFFHCGTSLIETFRGQYSHLFDFEKNRALVLRLPIEETADELRHCISQALRYKLDRTSGPVRDRLPVMLE